MWGIFNVIGLNGLENLRNHSKVMMSEGLKASFGEKISNHNER